MRRDRLGIVVQRYGADITGGSESLARAVAERLTREYDVTVFTTCARDYVTWKNELAPGSEVQNGVTVLRFRVEEERDLAAFNRFAEPLYHRSRTEAEELEWLRRQGPFVPELPEAVAKAKDSFRAILFFTYLYYPTYFAIQRAPERSILVPTAHDEPPLAFSIYDRLFALPKAMVFCSGPEASLVERRFGLRVPSEVAGIGVEGRGVDVSGFRRHHRLEGPYVLYAGRIDAGKGCDRMLSGFRAYQKKRPGSSLVLIGELLMKLPESSDVRYLGFVSEEEKAAALAGASVVLCPSPYESLSIVLLEGFLHGTPGLVNANSPVLKDHALKSNAALYYENEEEFVRALDVLLEQAELRKALGANGKAYVAREYTWDVVLGKYRRLVDSLAT